MRILFLSLILFVFSDFCLSQSYNNQARTRAEYSYKKIQPQIDIKKLHENVESVFDADIIDGLTQKKSLKGIDNATHVRYQQTYKSIPVLGGEVIAHGNASNKFMTSNILPRININHIPVLSEPQAIEKAKALSDAKEYHWEKYEDGEEPTVQLMVMDASFPNFSGIYQLVYAVSLYATQPLDKSKWYIDAHSGQLVKKVSELCHESVPASGKTLYYGEREFMTDSVAPNEYHLIDRSRGEGNTTYRDSNGRTVLTDSDNYWDLTDKHNHSAAIDAHWSTAEFYDLLYEYFGWEGLDGEGKAMDCVVNFRDGSPYVNAFWDGRYAWFGDGDCHFGPLTSLDVVAHEFTHGLTDYTSDLVYMDEPGALNESMSDIFGKACELYATPEDFDWYIGRTFNLTEFANPFRNMADPSSAGDPEYYQGNFWHVDESDNGGVHSNSGVLNYWFYLITDGASGENEKGYAFDIEGLGMETAIQIPFLMQSAYLTITSNYNDAYNASVLATESLYGAESTEMDVIKEAWKVVGLPLNSNQVVDLDLAVEFASELDNTCINNEPIDVEVRVSNIGIDTLFAGDTIKLVLNNVETNPYNYILTEDFLPGQDSLITLINGYTVIAEGNLRLDILLTNNDKVQGNNTDRLNFSNYFSDLQDLELSVNVPDNIDCYIDSIPIPISVRNSSCAPIPAGTEYTVVMKTGGQVVSEETFTNSSDIAVGGRANHEFFFVYPGNITILDFELLVDDIDVSNNFVSFQPVFVESSINEEYENSLNEESAFDDLIFLADEFMFGSVEYEGAFYMGTTGRSSDPTNICPFYQDNFTTNGSTYFEMCVDFEEYENIVLSFDLIQLRNEFVDSFPELTNSFCMTMVEWSSINKDSTLLINDQTEGEKYHYDLQLPDYFTGYIRFQFYNHIGNLNFSSSWALERHDYNLLDNLTLRGNIVSKTEENIATSGLALYPNPVSDVLFIDASDKEIHHLRILDLSGKVLLQETDPSESRVNISQLKNGMYFIQLAELDGTSTTLKFLKQ